MKKAWNLPIFSEISVSETACGGPSATTHDGCVYDITVDGIKVSVEEYLPASGTTCQCGKPVEP